MRYLVGKHEVEFYAGKMLVLRKRVKVCPLCRESFVNVSLGEGVENLYGNTIRSVLTNYKIKPARTCLTCEDCAEEWLARTSILEMLDETGCS